MIETIIFDYGGVINRVRRSDAFLSWLLDSHDVDGDALEVLFHGPWYRNYQRGMISERAFYDALRSAGVCIGRRDLVERWTTFNEPVPGMKRLIYELQRRFDLCLVSDSTPELTRDVRKRFAGVFRTACFSDEHGYIKQDRDRVLFDILFAALDRSTGVCLYIDDRVENLKYPESKGIHCTHFTGLDALVSDLDAGWGIRCGKVPGD